MNRNDVAAIWAFVLSFLLSQKVSHAQVSYLYEILNHAHVVSFTVPFVQVIQFSTWHTAAFKTELNLFFANFVTSLFEEGTCFVPYATA